MDVSKEIEDAIKRHELLYHARSSRFVPPTPEEVTGYAKGINFDLDGQHFIDFYESKGWMIGKNKMKDWKSAVRTWKKSHLGITPVKRKSYLDEIAEENKRILEKAEREMAV